MATMMASLPRRSGRMIVTLPPWTREDVEALMAHPGVAVAAIVGATLVILSALAGIVFLAYHGRGGVEAIGALILGMLTLVLTRLGRLLRDARAGDKAAP